jgi:hypothetical protein
LARIIADVIAPRFASKTFFGAFAMSQSVTAKVLQVTALQSRKPFGSCGYKRIEGTRVTLARRRDLGVNHDPHNAYPIRCNSDPIRRNADRGNSTGCGGTSDQRRRHLRGPKRTKLAPPLLRSWQCGRHAEGPSTPRPSFPSVSRSKPIVMIVSGSSDAGSPAANLRLSQRRASNVLQGLVARGIPVERFQLVAKGETDPAVPTSQGVSEERNRCVEITWR